MIANQSITLTVPVHCARTFLAKAYSVPLPVGAPRPHISMKGDGTKKAGEGSVTFFHLLEGGDEKKIRAHLLNQNPN